jgi:hypothetical protein
MDIPAQVNINKEKRVSLAATLGIALSTVDTYEQEVLGRTNHQLSFCYKFEYWILQVEKNFLLYA